MTDEVAAGPGASPCPRRAAGRPGAGWGPSPAARPRRAGSGPAHRRRAACPARTPRRAASSGRITARMPSRSMSTNAGAVGPSPGQQPEQLVTDPLPGEAARGRRHAGHGGLGRRVDAQAEGRREPHAAQETQRVLGEAGSGSPTARSSAGREIRRDRRTGPPGGPGPPQVIGHPGHGVDREVAAARGPRSARSPQRTSSGRRPSRVARLGAVGRDLHLHRSGADRDRAEDVRPGRVRGRARPPPRAARRWRRPSRPGWRPRTRSRTQPPTSAASWPAAVRVRQDVRRPSAGSRSSPRSRAQAP